MTIERAETMERATRLMAEQGEALATAWAERDALLTALQEVVKGKGRFSRDHLTHCQNAVEDMKMIAGNAIEQVTGVNPFTCPNCGEYRPDDAEFIAEHGRCWTCNDLADEARGGGGVTAQHTEKRKALERALLAAAPALYAEGAWSHPPCPKHGDSELWAFYDKDYDDLHWRCWRCVVEFIVGAQVNIVRALLTDSKAVLADETVDCGRDECGLYTHVAPCPLADLAAAIAQAEGDISCERCGARGVELLSGICGTCGDDLRMEALDERAEDRPDRGAS